MQSLQLSPTSSCKLRLRPRKRASRSKRVPKHEGKWRAQGKIHLGRSFTKSKRGWETRGWVSIAGNAEEGFRYLHFRSLFKHNFQEMFSILPVWVDSLWGSDVTTKSFAFRFEDWSRESLSALVLINVESRSRWPRVPGPTQYCSDGWRNIGGNSGSLLWWNHYVKLVCDLKNTVGKIEDLRYTG